MNHTPSNPNHPPTSNNRPADERRMVPLTVWLCSDPRSEDLPSRPSARSNREMSGTAICVQHRQSIGRELAQHLISTCTSEGALVADGFTTSEATLITAAELDRRAIALVPHFPLAQYIGNRLRAALDQRQLTRVQMRPVRPDQLAKGLADHLGRVSLVIGAPPPYETGGHRPRRVGEPRCPACRADLWMLSSEQLGLFMAAAWRVLAPGGVLAMITTARHQAGRLIDPAPRIISHAQSLGFRYAQHVIALRVPIEGDALVVQAGPTDLAQLRDTSSSALPPTVGVHAAVSLFSKPQQPASSPGPDGPYSGRTR
ncbi:DNA methyltransferase [Spirillospora sp. CA-108201]